MRPASTPTRPALLSSTEQDLIVRQESKFVLLFFSAWTNNAMPILVVKYAHGHRKIFWYGPFKWRSSAQHRDLFFSNSVHPNGDHLPKRRCGDFSFLENTVQTYVETYIYTYGRTVRGRRKDLISGTAGKRRHLNPFFCPAHFKNIILIQVVSLYMPTSKSTSLCMSSSNFSLETIYQFSLWLMINYISSSTISDISIETILNLSLWLLITNTI